MSAVAITEPGIYPDLPEKDYHAQTDWLSNSGGKMLLKPSCPAKFKAGLGQEEHKRHFDLGKVVHALVLGDGAEFEVVQAKTKATKDTPSVEYDALNYDTVSARTHRDAIYAAGKVPILAAELLQAQAMAHSVSEHPEASALLSGGTPEVSLFWIDPTTGVKCRARLDYYPAAVEGRRLIVPDLKTAVSSEPQEFGRAAARFGYVRQADWYTHGLMVLGIDPNPAFLFVVVEKDDPHVVTVGQFSDPDDLVLAAAQNHAAREVYAQCVATDTWPGYVSGVAQLHLPPWHHTQNEEFVA